MKFSRIDNTLIGFFILVFISSIYLLVVVQNNQEHVSQALEIGTIKEVNNSVKKRHYTMLTWHNAAVTDALQEDDVIFTSENSSALLMFNDGSLLNIEGDSLIRLKGEHGIILEKGQIQINNEQSSDPSKLTITLAQKNNQKLTMGENSIFKLSKNNDNIEINSIKGNGSLSSQDNTSEIKNGQNFNIEKNKIKKINLSISINESSIDNKTLRLEWISSEELKDFSVRVSEDFTFKKFSDISTQSPAKIPWDKPVAFVKVMAINKLAQQVQSAPLKVYSITKIEKAKGRNNDQDFSSRIVNLFNKMLENSNKGKK